MINPWTRTLLFGVRSTCPVSRPYTRSHYTVFMICLVTLAVYSISSQFLSLSSWRSTTTPSSFSMRPIICALSPPKSTPQTTLLLPSIAFCLSLSARAYLTEAVVAKSISNQEKLSAETLLTKFRIILIGQLSHENLEVPQMLFLIVKIRSLSISMYSICWTSSFS